MSADRGAGAALATAFSAHSRVHGADDGGFWSDAISLLHADGDQASPREDVLGRWSDLRAGFAAAGAKPGLALHAAGSTREIATLAELLPEARILHVLRDPRVTLAAAKAAGGAAGGMRLLAEGWLADVGPPLRFAMRAPERVATVSYEELLAHPAAQLEAACRWLAIPAETDGMASRLRLAAESREPPNFHAGALDRSELSEIESALDPLLALLGYEPAADEGGTVAVTGSAEPRHEEDQTEIQSLREALGMLGLSSETESQRGLRRAAGQVSPAELVRLRREAARYDDVAEELRLLRLRLREQAPLDLETLRWKAKRYDQIRAAASPVLRLRRRRARRRRA